jgi:hypothetical protein
VTGSHNNSGSLTSLKYHAFGCDVNGVVNVKSSSITDQLTTLPLRQTEKHKLPPSTIHSLIMRQSELVLHSIEGDDERNVTDNTQALQNDNWSPAAASIISWLRENVRFDKSSSVALTVTSDDPPEQKTAIFRIRSDGCSPVEVVTDAQSTVNEQAECSRNQIKEQLAVSRKQRLDLLSRTYTGKTYAHSDLSNWEMEGSWFQEPASIKNNAWDWNKRVGCGNPVCVVTVKCIRFQKILPWFISRKWQAVLRLSVDKL